MRQLSAQELALAVAIVVSHRRTRLTRRERARSTYIDDCFAILAAPAFNPKIRRLSAGVVRLEDAKRAHLCEETRELFESMEPVIRALSEGP